MFIRGFIFKQRADLLLPFSIFAKNIPQKPNIRFCLQKMTGKRNPKHEDHLLTAKLKKNWEIFQAGMILTDTKNTKRSINQIT